MKAATYIKQAALADDPRWRALADGLAAGGVELYPVSTREDIRPETDLLLSVGGDGTFLSASKRVGDSGIPVLGVNLGRLGFLSENRPEDLLEPVLRGDYIVEERTLLAVEGLGGDMYPHALNEVAIQRSGAAILGIRVAVDGQSLPVFWADGLLVATSSGSTAYSLSVGGPICSPEAPVLVIAPIAPHNLNVRPLVVPDSASIRVSFRSRDAAVRVTADNRGYDVPASSSLTVSAVPGAVGRVVLGGSNFISALKERLMWGGDIRNHTE